MGVGGVIGYEYPQGNPATASSGYTAQAIIHPDLVYTAQTDDVVTDVGVYVPNYNDGDCNIAIYEVASGVPTNRVGAVINVPVLAYTTGQINTWYRASCSIPLTAGTTYCVAIDYVGTGAGWFFTYGGITGMTAVNATSNEPNTFLPATWTHNGYDTNVVAFQARVTGTDSTQLLADTWTAADGTPWSPERWGIINDAGDGIVTIDSSSGHMYNGYVSAVSNMSATDFELLVKASWTTMSGHNPEIGWRLITELDGGPSNGYSIMLTPDAGGTVYMFKIDAFSSIASAADTVIGSAATVWFRIRVVGTNHKVRWWEDGDAEPSTWQMNVTDSTYLGGRFMLRNWGSADVYWDDLEITDLSGITAPKALHWSDYPGGYTRSASGLESSDLTMCGWYRRTDDAFNFIAYAIDDNGSNYFNLGCSAGSINLYIFRTSGDTDTGYDMVEGTWTHIAMCYVTATGVITVRATPFGGSTTTFTSSAGSGPGAHTLRLNMTYAAAGINDIANFKVWKAILSGGEITTEMAHYEAQRTTDLWGEWSLYNGSTTMNLIDTSGNGRDMVPVFGSHPLPYTIAGPAIDVPPPPSEFDLVVASAAHAHTADAVVTTLGIQLVVANAAHLQTSGGVVTTILIPVTQEGFRWRNDNGSEAAATWLAAQDTNVSLALATSARLRVVLDTPSDVAATQYTLYYKKSTDSTWLPVPVGTGGGSPVYVATSTNIATSGEVTTAQLTPPSGKTTTNFSQGRIWDDENGTDSIAIAVIGAGGAQSAVSLTPVDGEFIVGTSQSNFVGNDYYTRNSLTRATNWTGPNMLGGTFAGFDDLNFFPIGIWLADSDASSFFVRLNDLGVNGLAPMAGSIDRNNCITYGVWAIVDGNDEPSGTISTAHDPAVVGVITGDEPWTDEMWETQIAAANAWLAGPDGPGRFVYHSHLDNILNSGIDSYTPAQMSTQGHWISYDCYWFAGAPFQGFRLNFYLYHDMPTEGTPAQSARGSNYGSMIDAMRKWWSVGSAKPSAPPIENGAPYTEPNPDSKAITPAQMKWAIWSTLVHGAQLLQYFNHTFRDLDPLFSFNNFNHNGYGGPGVAGTGIYAAAKLTHQQIFTVASVLKSPFDGYLCYGDGSASFEHTGFLVSCTSTNARGRFSGIDASCRWQPNEHKHYIMATTRELDGSTNWPVTFRMVDQGQTQAVRLFDTTGTIPITRGGAIPAGQCQFTDTFATAASYKVYRIEAVQSPVALVAADGEIVSGSTQSNFTSNGFYKRSGFTRAQNWTGSNPLGGTFAGFDDPNFIPICIWLTDFVDPAFYTRMQDLACNGMLPAWESVNLNDLAPNGKWAFVNHDQHPGGTITTAQDPSVIGVIAGEEPYDDASYEAIVDNTVAWMATADGPGRMRFYNFTQHILNAEEFDSYTHADLVAASDWTTFDLYYISGSPSGVGGHDIGYNASYYLYNALPLDSITPAQIKRGSHYGSSLDVIRKHFAEGSIARKPTGIWVENGAPFMEPSPGSLEITPAQMKWAIWSVIVHGGRQINYFNHSFRDPAPGFSSNNFNDNYYGGPSVAGTGIYAAAKSINRFALSVASVINSPMDGYLCFGDGLASYEVTGFLTACTSTNARNYFAGIDASCRWHPVDGKHYIFATTREVDGSTNWPVTFRMVDQGQYQAVRLFDTAGTITILRGGSIPTGFCEFSDTFATAASCKAYRID